MFPYLLVSIFVLSISHILMSVTREKILELGEHLLQTKGYNAFSYQDISKELGVKNAAIHYYFPTKTSLVVSVVRNNALRFKEMIQNMDILKHNEQQKLEAFLKIYIKSNRDYKICLLGSLGSDFPTLDEAIQIELKSMTDLIIIWLSEILESGRSKQLFRFEGGADTQALMILSNLMAGLQLSWIAGRNTFKTIYAGILAELNIKS